MIPEEQLMEYRDAQRDAELIAQHVADHRVALLKAQFDVENKAWLEWRASASNVFFPRYLQTGPEDY